MKKARICMALEPREDPEFNEGDRQRIKAAFSAIMQYFEDESFSTLRPIILEVLDGGA